MKVCPSCGTTYPDHTSFCPEEGTALVPLSDAPAVDVNLVGERLFGDYLLKKKLGEGGMGAVYLAENMAIDQKIAVKVLHPSAARDDETLQRFNREANAIARLSHPNTIRVFIFGKTSEPLIYLAMEYVDGTTLRDELYDHGPFDELRAIPIMRQTLHALSEAHELGVVHRDLKPDNIMLTHFRGVNDFVKVLDFGIAKVTEPRGGQQKKLTQAGVVYGTPEYLSPEQARGRDIDHRADLYAMGIILYEMVTGVVPFTGDTALAILSGHVYQEPPDPSTVTDVKISAPLRDIILRAIQKNPDDRYQSAMQFLEALEQREAQLVGGKGFKTSMLDVRETGMVYQAARAAQLAAAVQTAESPTHSNVDTPTIATSTLEDTERIVYQAHPAQQTIIARQRTIIIALSAAFGVMTLLAIAAIFIIR